MGAAVDAASGAELLVLRYLWPHAVAAAIEPAAGPQTRAQGLRLRSDHGLALTQFVMAAPG